MTGRTCLLTMFHASTLVNPLKLCLTFLILFAHPLENVFAQLPLDESPLVREAESAQFVQEPTRAHSSEADPRAEFVSLEAFMNPSPLSETLSTRGVLNALQTSATVEMESVTRSGAHTSDANGTLIFSDGRLSFNLPDLAEGMYQVTFYAFGFPHDSYTPQFRVLADNKIIADSIQVTNQDWIYRPITISDIELAGQGHDFRIEIPGGLGAVSLYFDKVVFQKTGNILAPAQRVVLEAESMVAQGGYYQAPSSVLLWANGSLTTQRQVESGVYDIEVVAFGLEGDGDLPRMRFLAASRMVGDAVAVKNNNWNFQGYTLSGVELEGGVTDFTLQFFNDSAARDLWVDKIILRKRGELAYKGNRVVQQAESLSSSGSFYSTSSARALWNDGVLRLPLNDIQAGRYVVEFDAFGVPVNGVLPRAQVWIDGAAVGAPIEIANNGWNYQHFKSEAIDLKGGDHEVLIRLASGTTAQTLWLDRVLLRKVAEITTPQNTRVFSLALNSTILNAAAMYGPLFFSGSTISGWVPELTRAFLGVYQDVFDYLVFVPTLAAAERLSLQSKGSSGSNDFGSFSYGIFNDVQGIGGTYDSRSRFGSSAAGELEDMLYLDSGLFGTGDYRLSTSDFSKLENRLLWEHITAHELHHRFGSSLTADFGNPLRILGRQLGHWGPFFDADSSPMDGNDWVDNGDGTFTAVSSYVEEAAFNKAQARMPFNDLDLYAMGLLDASEVKVSFVIDNPRYNGLRLRPFIEEGDDPRGGGPSVQIELSPEVWSSGVYINKGLTVTGTRRDITLADILNYEGVRSPGASASPRHFKPAFVVLTDSADTGSSIQTQVEKVNLLQTELAGYYADLTRGLGTLTLAETNVSYSRSVSQISPETGTAVFEAQLASVTSHRQAQLRSAPPAVGGPGREYLVKDLLRPVDRRSSSRKPFKRKDLNQLFTHQYQTARTA